MATIDEAKEAWLAIKEGFVPRTPTRPAFLGDGIGFATSNMFVGANPAYVFARERLGAKNFFPVLNKNIVKPAFDMPVILGYTGDDPNFEQVLTVNWSAFDYNPSSSVLGGIGPHHTQHEFGGGDEVFIDGRLFKPGLMKPTSPLSMKVVILPFTYYYDEWKRFRETTTKDLSEYKPVADTRYVLVALDPRTDTLVYRPGNVFNKTSLGDAIGSPFHVPPPSGDEIPLGAVLLESTTTTINWHTATVDNIFDARLHIGFPYRKVLERLDNLEGSVGSHPTLPAAGAAGRTTNTVPGTIDGGIF